MAESLAGIDHDPPLAFKWSATHVKAMQSMLELTHGRTVAISGVVLDGTSSRPKYLVMSVGTGVRLRDWVAALARAPTLSEVQGLMADTLRWPSCTDKTHRLSFITWIVILSTCSPEWMVVPLPRWR